MSEPNQETRAPVGTPPPPYYLPLVQPYPEDEVDLLALWRRLWRQRWIIVAFTLVTTAAAAAYAFLATPIYRAEVVLAPVVADDSKTLAGLAGQFGGLASLVGIDLGGSDSDVEVSIATLQSRAFTDAFIRDKELLPVLFADDWDAERKVWTVEDPADVPTPWDAFKLFDEDVRSLSRDKATGLVTLAIEWKDPTLAAEWANGLVERVNRFRQQEAIAEAERSITYLHEQLRKTTITELQQAIYRLIESQTKQIMLARVRDQYAFQVVDPAAVADEDDFVKPNRPLLLALGVLGGGMLGVMVALVRGRESELTPSQESEAEAEQET